MTQTMVKLRTVAFISDQLTSCIVQFTKRNARFDLGNGRFIRLADCFINMTMFVTHFLEVESTCHIRTIALSDASHIKEDTVTHLQYRIVRFMMRVCCVSTKSNQRFKGVTVRTQIHINLQHLVCQFFLCNTFMDNGLELCHGLVVDV